MVKQSYWCHLTTKGSQCETHWKHCVKIYASIQIQPLIGYYHLELDISVGRLCEDLFYMYVPYMPTVFTITRKLSTVDALKYAVHPYT